MPIRKKNLKCREESFLGLSGWLKTWKIVYPRLIEIAFHGILAAEMKCYLNRTLSI